MADDNAEVLENEEHVLKIEAKEAVKEIRYAVQFVELSSKLTHTQQMVYFNMTTKENTKYCVELSASGFRIVGKSFDSIEDDDSKYFETIYALLDNISPGYRHTFGDALLAKLNMLQAEENSDDS
ncbi:GSK3-beta interaction protein-like [Lineus longissimus]|uniref:GSK3-beta interaction protein-like n=1 Tax=Lineus longissimus TaxID=88925 RepID=UPI002B4DE919